MSETTGTRPTYLETKVATYSPPPSHRQLSDEELMDPEMWDFGNAIIRPGNKKRARAVVSVAFSAEQFDIVSGKAERLGKYLSTWIREAALRAARR